MAVLLHATPLTNPLDKGAYDQRRSVVDYYDWLGRRYHIGVFGQRIYD
ncbi:hypothetical protein CfE428DRAFT_6539 [Chthoniobacter flavus Ellin428]|uniref:Uncharacterized protein n=1 Tax=Chthoniobacter flavus Ellin428 TaxID=497964 RepID=B4DC98_9BACT|nr:hypothetical protein [Chthoniobacter flavus]EDY15928.1 hypothetical protein CfE428DRAFT_6539 [Chthoniobacter flavus Ellin428]TCO82519.1 hypothetical protein EV701_1468 [Chthoniobacter flavus]